MIRNKNLKKPEAYFVVSAWNNDVSWIKDYTDRYIIYDKSHNLDTREYNILRTPNVGFNCHDICHFIVENYEFLPPLTAFLEGNPFDHCRRETFDKLIYNNYFTSIEDYSHVPESYAHKKAPDGGYMEINDSWYVIAHMSVHGKEVNRYFQNFNDFLDEMFINPNHPEWLRFCPGAQYIVPRDNILYYSKNFYKKIMKYVNYHRIPVEAFMVERMLYDIFTNNPCSIQNISVAALREYVNIVTDSITYITHTGSE